LRTVIVLLTETSELSSFERHACDGGDRGDGPAAVLGVGLRQQREVDRVADHAAPQPAGRPGPGEDPDAGRDLANPDGSHRHAVPVVVLDPN
jgi:hypothetical protein